jgi:hypothetical protein
VDIGEEMALVTARQLDSAEYCAVVAQWNEQVAAAPADASFTFFDFCRFLLATYDGIAAEHGERHA